MSSAATRLVVFDLDGTLVDSRHDIALAANLTNVAITGITIPANGSCTVTFTVTSNTAGVHPNATSGVSSNEAGTGAASNTASLTVSVNAAAIAKAFAPASIAYATGVSTLTFTLSNTNAIALTAGAFTDTLAGMALAAGMTRSYFNTSRLISSFMISEVPP